MKKDPLDKYIALGSLFGCLIGVMLNNIGLWIAFGISIGTAIGSIKS